MEQPLLSIGDELDEVKDSVRHASQLVADGHGSHLQTQTVHLTIAMVNEMPPEERQTIFEAMARRVGSL